MDYKYHITYKQYQQIDQRTTILDRGIFILTRNYLHNKIGITSTKGYSSVR